MNKSDRIDWVLVDKTQDYTRYEGYAATLPAAKRAARRMWAEACTGGAIAVYKQGGTVIHAERNPYGIAGQWIGADKLESGDYTRY